MKRGQVPGEPFGRIIQDWVFAQKYVKQDIEDITVPPLQWLAQETGTDVESLRKLKNGKRRWIGFDVADKLVTTIDPWLWRIDPELRVVYQSVDLGHVDRLRPCARLAA